MGRMAQAMLCSWLPPFRKQNLLLFIQPRWQLRRTYYFNHYKLNVFCFNEFAFTVQVKHKINSTLILGFILICLYFTTGHFHTCTLQRVVGCCRGYPSATHCLFSRIQIGFTLLVPAYLGSPGKRAVKRVCMCVYFAKNAALLILGSVFSDCVVFYWDVFYTMR